MKLSIMTQIQQIQSISYIVNQTPLQIGAIS